MHKPILLVEDDDRDLDLILMALEQGQLADEAVVVRDGVEALDYLLRRDRFATRSDLNPSIIFLDLKIPRLSGLEVLEAIRSTSNLKMIPVVVFSGSKLDSDLAEAYKLGANAFVTKPINFKEFTSAVSALGSFWAQLNMPPPGSALANQKLK
ncbi:response regulator [Pseudomonas sp. SMSB3]|uniref:response regulator n=1 Tax=Pseudomonas sp. SMSB3 TaxID=3390196 RepID=UPI003F85008E